MPSSFIFPRTLRGLALAGWVETRDQSLAITKMTLRGKWPQIKIVGVHTSGNGHYKVGEQMQVEALIDLPALDPKDLAVQLYAGPINGTGQIDCPQVLNMSHSKEMAPGRHLFTGKIECRTSGRQGFARRIVPGNEDMASPFEPGLITWN